MLERFNMKFTGAHSNIRIAPIMKVPKVTPNPNPTPAPTQQRMTNGTLLLASAWRAAYGNGGNTFPVSKGCGCGK